VIVVSNSSPLITLARIAHLDLLRQLFGRIHIAGEVHAEVVVRGAGRPAAEAVQAADWVEIHPPTDTSELDRLRMRHALGAGELATVLLAQHLPADLAIIDERSARRLALAQGVAVMGCVGILERGHRRGFVTDLRAAYAQLLAQGIRIDRQILDQSLTAVGLPPL
jgi:predicted nucleic acid-binding protein